MRYSTPGPPSPPSFHDPQCAQIGHPCRRSVQGSDSTALMSALMYPMQKARARWPKCISLSECGTSSSTTPGRSPPVCRCIACDHVDVPLVREHLIEFQVSPTDIAKYTQKILRLPNSANRIIDLLVVGAHLRDNPLTKVKFHRRGWRQSPQSARRPRCYRVRVRCRDIRSTGRRARIMLVATHLDLELLGHRNDTLYKVR